MTDIHGKHGKHGRDGARGPAGKDGLPGGDGPRGKSAFEVAVINGFEGTEQQWLEGLKGTDGLPGIKGDLGPRGPTGPRGPEGPIGPMPRHEWEGTELRFEAEPGIWGEFVDLKGPQGERGRGGGFGGGGSGAGGVSNFLALGDTPSTYVGSGGLVVAVKSDESGLEFVFAPSGGGTGSGLPGGSAGDIQINDGFGGFAGVTPGTDTEVLFNDSGSIAGDAGLTFDKTAKALSVGVGPFSTSGAIRLGDSAGGLGDNAGIWGYESDNAGDPIPMLRLTLDANDAPQVTLGGYNGNRLDYVQYGDDAGLLFPDQSLTLGKADKPFYRLVLSGDALNEAIDDAAGIYYGSSFKIRGNDGGSASYYPFTADTSAVNISSPGPSIGLQMSASYIAMVVPDAASTNILSLYGWKGGTVANSLPYFSIQRYDAKDVVGFDYPLDITGTNKASFWGNNLVGESANPYFLWYDGKVADGAAVWRVNALGQQAYYNPGFATDYTPGAANYERVVTQWVANVATIGTEAGGTGTLRALNLVGSSVGVNGSAFGSAAFVATSAFDAAGVAASAVSTHAALQTGVHGISIASGKTFTASNSLTLTATDGSTLAIGTGGTLGTAAYTAASAYEVPLTFSGALSRSVNTVTLANTAVTAGSYTAANITVDAQGRITAAANGSAGSGTVTATGGSLTSNAVVLGAGTTDTKVVAGITTDGTSALNLGVAGTSVGKVVFANATSGTGTLQPPTGALGTLTYTLPSVSSTLAVIGADNAFSTKQTMLSAQFSAADTVVGCYFGGTTSSFPALRRNAAVLEAVLADLGNFARFKTLQVIFPAGDASGTGNGVLFGTTAILGMQGAEISATNAATTVYTPIRCDQIRLLGASNTTVDTGLGRNAAGVVEFNSGTLGTFRDAKMRNIVGQTGYTEMVEMTAPAAGATNSVRIYAEDNGSGKTRLMALFPTGAAQQIAIEP